MERYYSLRYVESEAGIISKVEEKKDHIIEVEFFNPSTMHHKVSFNIGDTKDAYVFGKLMEMCGVDDPKMLLHCKPDLLLMHGFVVGVRGSNDTKFYLVPGFKVYDDCGKLHITMEELDEALKSEQSGK